MSVGNEVAALMGHLLLSNPKTLKPYKTSELEGANGYPFATLQAMGFTKRHLNWMEKHNLVIRARKPTKRGHVIHWVFLLPESSDGV